MKINIYHHSLILVAIFLMSTPKIVQSSPEPEPLDRMTCLFQVAAHPTVEFFDFPYGRLAKSTGQKIQLIAHVLPNFSTVFKDWQNDKCAKYVNIKNIVIGDLDNDGKFTPRDESNFKSLVESVNNQRTYKAVADLNNDGQIDTNDIEILNRFRGQRGIFLTVAEEVLPSEISDQGGAPTLTHGTMVGGVTANSAKVWFRVAPRAKVAIEYGTDPQLKNGTTQIFPTGQGFLTERKNDFTGTLELTNLSPQTTYYYRILINGQPTELPSWASSYSQFMTFPDSAPDEVTIGLLADAMCFVPAPQLANLKDKNPNFVLVFGDLTHNNATTLLTLRHMRQCVRDPKSLLGRVFSKHIAYNFPVAYMWDDHDFCDSDSDEECESRKLSVQVYNEYFPAYREARYTEGDGGGAWHSFQYGDLVEVFMLDLRYNRTNPDKIFEEADDWGQHTMLGKAQREWLKKSLEASKAKWKVMVSTVPFNRTTHKLLLESWGSFEIIKKCPPDAVLEGMNVCHPSKMIEERKDRSAERNWLIDLINATDPEHTVFVSGDIHLGGAIDDGTYSDFPEMSVPSINTPIRTCDPDPDCNTEAACSNNERACGVWSQGKVVGNSGYGIIKANRSTLTMSFYHATGEKNGQPLGTYTIESK